MNVRLKLASKEQKSCTSKMAENSSEAEADRVVDEAEADRVVDEAEAGDLTVEDDTEEVSASVGKKETVAEEENNEESTTNNEHSVSESEDSSDKKGEGVVSRETNSLNNKKANEHKENASEELKNVVDVPNPDKEQKENKSDEMKSKKLEKASEDSTSSSSDESAHDDEKSNTVSKLDADALSASLSSSKCLLKRNRDDLDSDDDDSGEEVEEPFSKKSHIGEVTPKHVSKLKSTELLASMSSSKSLLKRGIEKVDKANIEEATDAPESKKSNLAQTPKPDEEESPENVKVEDNLKHRKEIVTHEEIKPLEARIAPKTLKFPLSPSSQTPAVKSLLPTPLTLEPERPCSAKEEPAVREEPRQRIGAKELAGQRQLERKRLNKMLAIFDDQKILK